MRTVTSVLRILGLARERRWVNYHHVLSRTVWSPRAASYILLRLLVRAFAPTGPLVLGIDDTIERRRGKRIRAKGIYRDAVRSSRSQFVKASGLRWLSVMLLAPIPWAGRIWALPFLTALAPSPRYSAETGGRHKRLTDWARQLIRQVRRWQVEVTFEETRRHLGVETQRQWSDLAIARTTPILLGLFSLVTLLAARLVRDGRLPVRTAAWYVKTTPTFSDALAAVRRQWWRTTTTSCTSRRERDMIELPRHGVRRLSEAVCYAA